MQTQQELHQNDLLRDENDKLRAENEIYKGALKDTLCTNCTGPISIGEMSSNDNQLRIENARLKVEIEMLTGKVINDVDVVGSSSKIGQMPTPAFEIGSNSDISSSMIEELCYGGNDPLGSLSIPNEVDKATIVELAVVSMEELTILTLAGSPLWISTNDTEILNEAEYVRVFPNGISPKLMGLKSESSCYIYIERAFENML
ncbi:hypothetical protein MtrunA17_Chr1g0205981 [Medicago truncatula]|uniref:Uncharacterized protein n=1 Tax=Medicago truncatula TaxID=3880 RepID=A0A396K1Z5_MEDTR|nr:hypothetical protein MtrunA17_Chr1g0205981 [Medicago truncatula]